MDSSGIKIHAANASPVEQTDRITILDSLRGIAILGILLMNIPGFGLPFIAIKDLSILGEISKPDMIAWILFDGIFEGSMRALFSMLFGAGVFLFIGRLEKRNDGIIPAEIYFRRQMWLLFFGLLNAYLFLWFWDILFAYGACGMLLFAFRRLPARHLLIAAGICLLFATVRENAELYQAKSVIEKGEAVAAPDKNGVKLTADQNDALYKMHGMMAKEYPENKLKEYQEQLRNGTGTYDQVYEQNSGLASWIHTSAFYYFLVWDVLLFMLIGLAFFKAGILTGMPTSRIYWLMMIGGLSIGLTLSWIHTNDLVNYNFNNFLRTKEINFEFYELHRFFRAIGIFGLIMLMYKSGLFNGLFNLMKPVGQMAFTNYLMQSVICGIIFWGPGFAMFGKLHRFELYYVVAGVWIFQIIFSHLWLKLFRFGPFEWLWRSLTYWKVQPIKRKLF